MGSRLAEGIDEVHAVDLAGMADGALLEDVDDLLVQRNRLDAAVSLRLGQLHTREITVAATGLGVKPYLVDTHHFGGTDAGRHVQVARALPSFPLVTGRYVAGDLSFEAVRAIINGLGRLPEALRPTAEASLVDAACAMSVDDLGDVLDALRAILGDETATEREQRRYDSR